MFFGRKGGTDKSINIKLKQGQARSLKMPEEFVELMVADDCQVKPEPIFAENLTRGIFEVSVHTAVVYPFHSKGRLVHLSDLLCQNATMVFMI